MDGCNNMIVHCKGPNINTKMNMRSSFRANLMSANVNMPRNFEKQSYAESLGSQRSLYYRRENSPTASIRSEFQPRKDISPTASIRSQFQPMNFYLGGYSQRQSNSLCKFRGGSPTSIRSNVSTAPEIAQAISAGNFNEHELQIILQAMDKTIKKENRKKAKTRRKIKSYIKCMRRSSDDSGEQVSTSSISSDDCMSVRTHSSKRYNRNFKENVPQSVTSLDSRSIIKEPRKDHRDSMSRDLASMHNIHPREMELYHSENMIHNKNNTHKKPGGTFSLQTNNVNAPYSKYINGHSIMSTVPRNTLNSSIASVKSWQSSTMSQKDRFQRKFQFPSQRFNNTVMPIEEHKRTNNKQLPPKGTVNNNQHINKPSNCSDGESDEDNDIFAEPLKIQPNELSTQKRKIESLDDVTMSAKKKYKPSPDNKKSVQKTGNTKTANNDFVFMKPQFPLRKLAHSKPAEKLISKSAEPFLAVPSNAQIKDNPCIQTVAPPMQENEVDLELSEFTQLTSSNMSQRPSFMKRKLFTQTLDVTERKNNSCESLVTDSPQSNMYSALSREKHRTRKLVSSQSLLSRDINQDDNNLLDLIHKIVPPGQVNTTNVGKSTRSRVSKNTADDGDDKWEITSIISTSNNANVSDTYTDDEIFKVDNEKKNKSKEKTNKQGNNTDLEKSTTSVKSNRYKAKKDSKTLTKECFIGVQKLPIRPTHDKECPAKKKNMFSNSKFDAFWNSDTGSDFEYVEMPQTQKRDNVQGVSDLIASKQSSTKNLEASDLSSVTVKKNDSVLVKELKKQTNRKINNKMAPPEKHEKIQEPEALRTRRQVNLSSVLGSTIKSRSGKMVDSPHTTRRQGSNRQTIETKKAEITKKQPAAEITKAQQKQNNRKQQPNNTRKECPEDMSKTRPKNTKVETPLQILKNDVFNKVLRSRVIDLSSSFNSDKFELTGISRTRNSRTPSKRISFSKSGITNKTRRKRT